ncbi:sulfatase [Cytophagaceae bacterium DM2B3-1]|uniref:Sulfatase n=1 Tax=Xanthocytophaga flava TaxID=3048013 RepID=A0ABT7CJE4_9BACT|nr:sulfatase [Xanthocytophaga flavus]MDJ1467784.1 sulfatase [Xanthocytophaga flavus]MDJ1493862.1 sulfatase [Xanthocytophaga flavus]
MSSRIILISSYTSIALFFTGIFLSIYKERPKANIVESAQKAAQPNIVLILADDLGYGDIGAYGATDVRTPHIDQLATQGIKFTSFYTPSPVCSPTRAGLLTGRYPCRMGIDGVFFPESYTGIPASEVTIAEALKQKGYSTGIVGKWHLGHHRQFLPLQNGFDYYFGIPYSNDMQGVVYLRNNEVAEFKVDQHLTTKTYTQEAIQFIEKNKSKPFFLYLAHNMPHVPLYASSEFSGKSKRGLYGDVIEELDWSVGEVVKTLKKNNLDQNTLVIFTSDNGPWLAFDVDGGSPGVLREGKQTTFEGGQRVPFVAYYPPLIKAGQVNDQLATMFDLFPTFLSLAGSPDYKSPNPLDGEDITSVLAGKANRKGNEFLYYYNGQIQAYRKGDWKIKFPYKGNKGIQGVKDVAPHDTLLFNLKEDIGEKADQFKVHPEKVADLLKSFSIHKSKVTAAPTLVQRMPADDSHMIRYKQRKGLATN